MMLGHNRAALEVCARIPRGSTGVEIGVWRGDSSTVFLERAGFLHLVDPWAVEPYQDDDFAGYLAKYARLTGSTDPADFQRVYDRIHADVVARFQGQPVRIHRCTSAAFFGQFTGLVDWVYIDGLHTFEACAADIEGARRIVRPRGLILGDDYGNKPGVTRAVDASGYGFEVFAGNQWMMQF